MSEANVRPAAANNAATIPAATAAQAAAAPAPAVAGAQVPKRINVESLRVKSDVGAAKPPVVRDPKPKEKFRTQLGAGWPFATKLLEVGREHYMVESGLWTQVEKLGKLVEVELVPVKNSAGEAFLWAIPVSGGVGRSWAESKMAAAKEAKDRFVQISSDRKHRRVVAEAATGNLAEPMWGDITVDTWLNSAFADRYIDREDHKLLKELRGDA